MAMRGCRFWSFQPRTARFYEYENAGMIHALSEKIEAGNLQVFCVDSVERGELVQPRAFIRTTV